MIPIQSIDGATCSSCEPCAAIPTARLRQSACRQLGAHLRLWLGDWPGNGEAAVTVGSHRDRPRWDGGRWPLLGVQGPTGSVLSVSPGLADRVEDRSLAALAGYIGSEGVVPQIGELDEQVERLVFRWTARPADLPEAGEWVSPDDPRVPEWLRPFNGDVLIAWDEEGRYAAGVGRKAHNAFAQEIAVGTEPRHRGKGLAPRLVAQAARRILEEGALPLYLHALSNDASARVAEKAGFPDRGWRAVWVE